MKYALQTPVVIQGNKEAPPITVAEFTFRDEMCAGDMRDLPLSSIADPMSMSANQALKLVARMTGQPDAVLNKLTPADTAEVIAVVLGFFKAGPETGIAPSP